MLPSEVIVISDDSEGEFTKKNCGYMSSGSDIIVLSDSSPAPEPPASSQPRPSQGEDDPNDAESDVDFLNTEGLISSSQAQVAIQSSPQHLGRASKSPRKRINYLYRSVEDFNDSDDSLIVGSPEKPPKRRRKSDEEKALEKAGKEAQKLANKEDAKRKREETAARKASENLARKAVKDANKLVFNKKATLKDMTVELSPCLLSTSLYQRLIDKMREFECVVHPMSDPVIRNSITNHPTNLNDLDIKLIRWKRRVAATFDEQQREWIPLAENERYSRTEGTYLIYMTGDDVLHTLSRNTNVPTIKKQVGTLRKALGPRHHIHLMLCGWKNKAGRKEAKELIEKELVGLQVREGLFVEQVSDDEEAANWIYNMSADLGIKPHKLIERSHLPFCALPSSAFKVGKSDADTMTKMLAQLPRLTDTAAKAIVREYGTINRLMEAYEQAERTGGGPMMLANVVVPRTKTGKDVPRILNKALSERLHNVLWGNDPKALAN